jgi:uncharacterized membrane protein YedE/YeeE
VTGLVGFWLLERSRWVTPLGGPLRLARTSVRPRHLYGGLLFGVGWALSTTCPVPALAMVVGGGVLGLAVMAGLLGGILLGDRAAHILMPTTRRPVPALRTGGTS